MNIAEWFAIFERVIEDYHIENQIERKMKNPFSQNSILHLLYEKSWIDTVQWHCEDEVRNPIMEAEQVRFYKNKIDALNQKRTNLVEQLDDYFYHQFQSIKPMEHARVNTETPAWAIDRLSILALKIYHMQLEVKRTDLTATNKMSYTDKLNLLLKQKSGLISAIQCLIDEIRVGQTTYHLYRQVKMYNDEDLNPVLRNVKL